MRARKYNKKITFYSTLSQSDGFGGNTIVNYSILNTWANLQTLDKFRFRNVDFGDIDLSNSVIVTMRKRNDFQIDYKKMFFKYRNYDYVISDRAVNKNFQDDEITFLAIRQNEVVARNNAYDIYSLYAQSILNENGGVLQQSDCTLDEIKELLQ